MYTHQTMYAVYVLLLEDKHLYVGITPVWRIKQRYIEHLNRVGARWTTKYGTLKKVCSVQVGSHKRALQEENRITEDLMRMYGLDACRGGDKVMAKEGGTWWITERLRGVPRFTEKWRSLNETMFKIDVCSNVVLKQFERLHSRSYYEKQL